MAQDSALTRHFMWVLACTQMGATSTFAQCPLDVAEPVSAENQAAALRPQDHDAGCPLSARFHWHTAESVDNARLSRNGLPGANAISPVIPNAPQRVRIAARLVESEPLRKCHNRCQAHDRDRAQTPLWQDHRLTVRQPRSHRWQNFAGLYAGGTNHPGTSYLGNARGAAVRRRAQSVVRCDD